MKKNKLKNKTIKLYAIVISLLVLILVISIYGYAKYVSKVEGNATAAIAHFNFSITEESSQSLTINLAETRLNDTESVHDSTVAPGTKGALQFNINADVSDVSIGYNINIDLTNVPKNLIFYYDENLTNAIYYSNDSIDINGFFSKDLQTKADTKIIYWSWPLETGQTQAQIDENDVIDSNSIGDEITIDINVIGQQVKENTLANQYAVTFDANGGAIPGYGNSQKVTRIVDYDKYSEDALVPIRDGYKFEGWYSSIEGPKNMIYRLHKFSGANTARYYLQYSALWNMSNDDIGRHLQAKINITGDILQTEPELIEFNDLELTKNAEYYISGEPGNWTVYIDFDITEQMITKRHYGGGTYDYATLRFIDIVGEYYNSDDATYAVDYLIIDSKRFYGDDGKLVSTDPLKGDVTVYANWVED